MQKFAAAGLLVALIAVSLLALPGTPARAQSQPTDDDVNRVAHQLYCPVCESIPLDTCSTKACADWRDLIRQKLAQGQSDQQIIDYFVATYGDRVLVQPPAHGFNWLIYIVPPVVLLGGALLAWRVLGGLVRTPKPVPAAVEPQDKYAAELEREVREAEE